MMLRLSVLLCLLEAVAGCSYIHYNRLGNFTDCPPYGYTASRPIGHLPWSPEKVNVQYFLFTRQNRYNYQVVSALNVSTVYGTNFYPNRKSVFIVHGFRGYGDLPWMVTMCQTILQVRDVNCFCVDWKGGAAALYTQACANVQVAGAEMAYFINYLHREFGHLPILVHLIGHSLGSHVVAEAGRRTIGLGIITALDPAGPWFSGTPAIVRLDVTDAIWVMAVHTDGSSFIGNAGLGGYGMKEPTGIVDFYPNGGEQMPGCDKPTVILGNLDDIMEGVSEAISCNHHKSVTFFIECILNPDGFMGYRADSYRSFLDGSGFPCDSGRCAPMQYYDTPNIPGLSSTGSQTFYLNTGATEKFARWRYRATIYVVGSNYVPGSLMVSLCKSGRCTRRHEIYSGFINSGGQYSAFIDAEADVFPVDVVLFSWDHSLVNLFQQDLGATAMTLVYGPNGNKSMFCGVGTVPEKTDQRLVPCSTPSQ